MTTATLTKMNTLTRDAVTQQLEWDSEFDASAVGITERDGTRTGGEGDAAVADRQDACGGAGAVSAEIGGAGVVEGEG